MKAHEAARKGSLAGRLARCLFPRARGRGGAGSQAPGPKAAAAQRPAARAAEAGRAEAATEAAAAPCAAARVAEGAPAGGRAADAGSPAAAAAWRAAGGAGGGLASSGLRAAAAREANPIVAAAEEGLGGSSPPSSPSGGAARGPRLPRRSRAFLTNGSVAAMLSGAEGAAQWPPGGAPPLPQELLVEAPGEPEGAPAADASELLPPLPPPCGGAPPCGAASPPREREAAPPCGDAPAAAAPPAPRPRERPVPRSYRSATPKSAASHGAARGSLRDGGGDPAASPQPSACKLASPSRPLTGTTTGDDSLMNASFSTMNTASWREEWTPGSTQRLRPSLGGPSRLPPIGSGKKAPPLPAAPPRLPPVDPGPLSRLPPMPPAPPAPAPPALLAGREPEALRAQPEESDQWLSEAALAAVPPALGSRRFGAGAAREAAANRPMALAAEGGSGTPGASQVPSPASGAGPVGAADGGGSAQQGEAAHAKVLDEAAIKKANFSDLALAFITMEEFA